MSYQPFHQIGPMGMQGINVYANQPQFQQAGHHRIIPEKAGKILDEIKQATAAYRDFQEQNKRYWAESSASSEAVEKAISGSDAELGAAYRRHIAICNRGAVGSYFEILEKIGKLEGEFWNVMREEGALPKLE